MGPDFVIKACDVMLEQLETIKPEDFISFIASAIPFIKNFNGELSPFYKKANAYIYASQYGTDAEILQERLQWIKDFKNILLECKQHHLEITAKRKSVLDKVDENKDHFLQSDGHFVGDSSGNVHINMPNDLEQARLQLMVDGFMKQTAGGSFVLTGYGRSFLEKCGYKALFKERDRINKLNEDQIQSVIDTNRSVDIMNNKVIPSNNRKQFYLTYIIACAAIIQFIIALMAYYKEDDPLLYKDLKLLQLKEEKLERELYNKIDQDADLYQVVKDSLKIP